MLTSLFPCLFFLLHLSIPTAAVQTPYKPTDYFLLNCGASSKATFNGRNWDTDAHLKFLPPNMADVSSTATASKQGSTVDLVPYMTARIFHAQFNYAFPVSPGPKFLRLYFYPATYSDLDKTQAFFTVSANEYVLLRNFSAFLTVSAATRPHKETLVKEFIINFQDNQILNLTFSPSPNSYSFVNGIEIVSMPYNLYLKDQAPKSVNQMSLSNFDKNRTAFETLYRLNVGGNYVQALEDTGMFREWSQDDSYIHGAYKWNPLHYNLTIKYPARTPPYTAPETVYQTARAMGPLADKGKLTWTFPVDFGFVYLLSLHFCEIQSEFVNGVYQRVFSVSIQNKIAEPWVDIMHESNGNGIPILKEFVVWVPPTSSGSPSKPDLWLSLFPNLEGNPKYVDAFLNGLEIFKLNSSDGNLAGPNPELLEIPDTRPRNSKPTEKESGKSWTAIYAVIGGVVGAAAVFLILVFLIFRRRRRSKDCYDILILINIYLNILSVERYSLEY